MIELHGKRNSALIFADKIDKQTKTQIASLLREPAYSDSKIRIMPDVHSGKSVAVGTTMTLSRRVSPALLGEDIGCGMETVFLHARDVDLEKLDKVIHASIPCGAKVHRAARAAFDLDTLKCRDHIDRSRALCSLGTLGGGNHFIELDRAEDGSLVLVIHSGSRQLGHDVTAYYREQACRAQYRKIRKRANQKRDKNPDDEYCPPLRTRERKESPNVNRETAILEGALYEDYLHDMHTVIAFADLNRRTMASLICDAMQLTVKDRFSCIHNYINTNHMILRKGAISARQGERVIIPLNMRDGAILGVGLGNPDWNFSAPHGAGRVCSRTEAKFAFTLDEFRAEMDGIYTTTAQPGSIDECPMAYKKPERILNAISDTVSVEQLIRPIYNFKSC
ncbi:MAG: RtcB family protein [Clostridia bacterium]|nr:RtcB family protein [Clostridia bacterium]